jgi:hypothetical protein
VRIEAEFELFFAHHTREDGFLGWVAFGVDGRGEDEE